jgi:hypothetical protein
MLRGATSSSSSSMLVMVLMVLVIGACICACGHCATGFSLPRGSSIVKTPSTGVSAVSRLSRPVAGRSLRKYGRIRMRGSRGGDSVAVMTKASVSASAVGSSHTETHLLTPEQCLQQLDVSISSGLSAEEHLRRLTLYGRNVIPKAPGKTILQLVKEQFEDRLVQILLGVAVASSVIALKRGDWHELAEPAVILMILFLNAIVGIYHRFDIFVWCFVKATYIMIHSCMQQGIR